MLELVGAATHELGWLLDGRGAARGRTERAGLVLEVRAASGAIGRGEASPLPGMSPDTLAQARSALAGFTDRLPVTLDGAPAVFALAETVKSPSARFAVETALLDLLARARGISIAGLFDAGLEAFDRAVARIRQLVEGDPAIAVALELPSAVVVDDAAEALVTRASHLKIKLGDRPIGDEVARVRAIARAAPHARLRLDVNRRWPRDRAVAYLAELAGLPIDFVEEPCARPHELLDEPLAVPIALDESLVELAPEDLFKTLEAPQLGALILKPTLLGGFSPCIALAALARFAGKSAIVTHTLEGELGRAACRELARVVGGELPHGLGAPLPASPAPGCGPAVAVRQLALVATPSLDTVASVWAALAHARPIAPLHHALPAAELAHRRALVEAAVLEPDDAVVLFTSGSTGEARGVVLTRAGLDAAAEAHARHLGWRDDDVWFVPLSLAHAGGLAAVYRCWRANRPIELLDGAWDRARAAALLERCTLASLVPTQLAELLADPAWQPPRQLRAVLLGGAAASPALLAAAAARGVPFLTTYGMTESFGQLATAPPGRAGDPEAPLVPLPGVELLAGTRAAPAPIRVRAAMLASRYLDGERIAPELVTRDLGYLEQGALVVVGRADDVIITGGENVHPATVEAVLAATPGVRAAIAFGIADDRWGQLVGAAIAIDPADPAAVDPETLARWHAALPAHARPRELAIVRELPRLATGKLDRRAASQLPRRPVRYH